ncbi:MAG: PH domain-containing protein [Micavibrio sp.]|nr:PH domain-containing protein [Micavibrio sp.]
MQNPVQPRNPATPPARPILPNGEIGTESHMAENTGDDIITSNPLPDAVAADGMNAAPQTEQYAADTQFRTAQYDLRQDVRIEAAPSGDAAAAAYAAPPESVIAQAAADRLVMADDTPEHFGEAVAPLENDSGLPAAPAEDGGFAVPSVEASGILATLLLPGERVIHQAAISTGIYWKGIALALGAVIALFFSALLALYFLVVAAIVLFIEIQTKRYLLLAATDRRVVMSGGGFSTRTIELPYSKIEAVDVMATPMGMLLGYASVIFVSGGNMRFIVPFVADASAFRDDMTRMLLAREEAAMAPAAPQMAAAVI